MRRGLIVCLVALSAVRAAYGQSSAAPLISAARTALEAPNPDAAAVLLERALEPGLGATPAEQTRAWVLYGIAQLMRDNAVAARAAFRQALQRDPSLRVDSLTFFTDALEREFNAERVAVEATVASVAPLVLEVQTPLDTALAPTNPEFPMVMRVSRRARVVLTYASASEPSSVLWADTAEVQIQRTLAWNLRDGRTVPVPSGRYLLRVTAIDSAGGSASEARLLDIARPTLDTTPPPAPLAPSAFAAETLHAHHSVLIPLAGLALGAGVLAIAANGPKVNNCLGQPSPCQNPGSVKWYHMVVGFGVPLASIVWFLWPSRRVDHAAIRHNQELRDHDAQQRASISAANAQVRNAPILIRVAGAIK